MKRRTPFVWVARFSRRWGQEAAAKHNIDGRPASFFHNHVALADRSQQAFSLVAGVVINLLSMLCFPSHVLFSLSPYTHLQCVLAAAHPGGAVVVHGVVREHGFGMHMHCARSARVFFSSRVGTQIRQALVWNVRVRGLGSATRIYPTQKHIAAPKPSAATPSTQISHTVHVYTFKNTHIHNTSFDL